MRDDLERRIERISDRSGLVLFFTIINDDNHQLVNQGGKHSGKGDDRHVSCHETDVPQFQLSSEVTVDVDPS